MLAVANRFMRAKLRPETYSSIRRLVDIVIPYRRISYAQFGEDLFLAERFRDKKDGFFVDVGAYHPRQLSNTYALYQRGWRGINIDATPGSMKLFNLLRPRDLNIEAAISDHQEQIDFVSWGTNPENTAFPSQADGAASKHGNSTRIRLSAIPLKDLIDNLPLPPTHIDLLSVDVEAYDLIVLRSFDWIRYRPNVVIAERFADTIQQVVESDLYLFMLDQGYRLAAWYRPSLIFEC